MASLLRSSLPLNRLISSSSTSIFRSTFCPALLLLSPHLATRPTLPSTFIRLASTGSGQGGKLEKDATKAAKSDKAKLAKEKTKETEKALKLKEKEKAKAKLAKEKEKEKAKEKAAKEKLKLKEREKKLKEKKISVAQTVSADGTPKIRRVPTSSLHPPKLHRNIWSLFLSDYILANKALASETPKKSVAELSTAAGLEYRSLSAEARESLITRLQEEKDAYPPVYEAWKSSLTPEMIKAENKVRRLRKKLGKSTKRSLKLDGEPARPKNAYLIFYAAVRDGEFGDLLAGTFGIPEQSRIAAAKWRTLTTEERSTFEELAVEEKKKYAIDKAAFDKLQQAKEPAKSFEEIVD